MAPSKDYEDSVPMEEDDKNVHDKTGGNIDELEEQKFADDVSIVGKSNSSSDEDSSLEDESSDDDDHMEGHNGDETNPTLDNQKDLPDDDHFEGNPNQHEDHNTDNGPEETEINDGNVNTAQAELPPDNETEMNDNDNGVGKEVSGWDKDANDLEKALDDLEGF